MGLLKKSTTLLIQVLNVSAKLPHLDEQYLAGPRWAEKFNYANASLLGYKKHVLTRNADRENR